MVYISFLKSFKLASLLTWSGYGMSCAALIALLLWPKNNKPTFKRMILAGLSIPLIVISILSLTFSVVNPGFPDAMEDGIETNIFRAIDGGVMMFFVFSLLTFGAPFILGPFLSFMFVEPKDI